MASTLPSWPPKMSKEQVDALSRAAVDYALSHSIAYRPLPLSSTGGPPPHDAAIHAPISLLPSPFPAALYEQSQRLQPLYNDLYARITVDHGFLAKVIGGNVILVDEFQAQLWALWNRVRKEGVAQPLHLGLFRSDYLLHQVDQHGTLALKQVELNTISSSFGPLCTRVSELHRHLASSTAFYDLSPHLRIDQMPKNRALETLASGLAAGHHAYLERTAKAAQSDDVVILFVVQDGERNAFDQRLIEYQLLEQHGVRVRRASLQQLSKTAKLSGDDRRLYVTDAALGRQEQVSVVYFRAGYTPGDYPTEREWETRLQLELSLAIKCPTAALQLAGAKKVQQVLADPGVLESLVQDDKRGRFWSNDEVDMLRQSFMSMYGMETDGEGVAIASDPNRAADYVLKPQREGGGNNIYRDDIVPTLQNLDKLDAEQGQQSGSDGSARSIKRREAYILMKLIEPPSHLGNYLVRYDAQASAKAAVPHAVLAPHVISELGAFGTILFESLPSQKDDAAAPGPRVVFEQSGGHLLRTKASESNEGGVAAGYSVIDSPVLI